MNELERRPPDLNPWVKFALKLAPRGNALAELVSDLQGRKHKRALTLISDTATEVGIETDALFGRILDNERKMELLETALTQAAATANSDKRRALARALAIGVLDDERIDEAGLLLSMLEGIENAHIKVLHELSRPRPGEGQLEGFETFGGVTVEFLNAAFPGYATMTELLLSHLHAQGLITNTIKGTFGALEGQAMWGVTSAGERLLALLREEVPE